ncbi:MAG: polysaccharide deacetylase family protein [Armatimonadota bacterium]
MKRTISPVLSSYYWNMLTIKRNTVILALITALLAFAGSACFCASEGYLDHVSDALDELEKGNTNESAAALREAMSDNSGDALAYVAMGMTMLCGGSADSAYDQFDQALNLNKHCSCASYGKGLYYLSKNKLKDAAASFTEARDLPTKGALGYVKAIDSGKYAVVVSAGEDESLLAMNALCLMSENNYAEAMEILKGLQKKSSGRAFGERIGCVMTFLKSTPVHFSGWPIKSPTNRVKSKLPEISGTITLRADLSKADSVRIVTFLVDGRLVGMTNNPPFTYSWDTTRIANGTHNIKIIGTNAYGSAVSDKSIQVMVRNAVSGITADPVSGERAIKLWARLWNIMYLRPSRAGINYNLARCALRLHDEQMAIDALERTVAANPRYLDVSDLIAKLDSSRGNSEKLYGVKTNRKIIALSFDDGPKQNSGLLLDILKQKDVKATFFVVGKQVEIFPDILKRMTSEGHDIQNHTYNHRALEFLSPQEIEQEIAAGSVCVRETTGRGTQYIRPPGGRSDGRLAGIVKQMGKTAVYWTADCASFEGTTKERMHHFVMASARPGAIILMHNLEGVTLQALPSIIDDLRSKGYKFVTISELAANADPKK